MLLAVLKNNNKKCKNFGSKKFAIFPSDDSKNILEQQKTVDKHLEIDL